VPAPATVKGRLPRLCGLPRSRPGAPRLPRRQAPWPVRSVPLSRRAMHSLALPRTPECRAALRVELPVRPIPAEQKRVVYPASSSSRAGRHHRRQATDGVDQQSVLRCPGVASMSGVHDSGLGTPDMALTLAAVMTARRGSSAAGPESGTAGHDPRRRPGQRSLSIPGSDAGQRSLTIPGAAILRADRGDNVAGRFCGQRRCPPTCVKTRDGRMAAEGRTGSEVGWVGQPDVVRRSSSSGA
jgi:hypothetical protein